MTINLADNDPRIEYTVTAGSSQQVFTVPFEFFEDEDLNVYQDGVLKTLTTHYTTADNNDPLSPTAHTSGTTGYIHFTAGNIPTAGGADIEIVITRSIDKKRTTDFPTSGPFDVNSLNEELDKLIAITAELQDGIDRSLRLTDYDQDVALTLPAVDSRKGKLLAFNATTGAVEAGATISGTTTVAGVAADIETLADIEDGTVATNAISDLAAIATDVTGVNAISSAVTGVNNISTAVSNVNSNSTNINTVSTNITSVNTVATNINDVITVANDLNEAISEIETAADDLNEAVSEIDTVATNIANVNTVGNDLSGSNTIGTVATDIANVNTVATDITNVNTVATNILDVNNFADTYFISATAPLSPTTGDLWFDTTNSIMKVYDGSGFVNAGSSVNGTAERQTYTATSGQTTFAATYDAGYVDVYLNGVKLIDGTDFTATSGSNIVLTVGATTGDTVDIVAYGTFNVADVGASLTTLGISNHNNLTVDGSGNVSVSGTLGVTGATTLSSTLGVTGVTTLSNNLDIDGNELILDADGDTSITADTDDQIDVKVAGTDKYSFTGTAFNIKGNDLILDADGDSKIEVSTDDTINIISGGTTGLTVNSSGIVLQPAKPYVAVDCGGGAYISVASGAAMPFDNVYDGNTSYWNTSTYEFTCPVDGLYLMTFAGLTSPAAAMTINFQKNNTNIFRLLRAAERGIDGSYVVQCAANDTLRWINGLGTAQVFYHGTTTLRYTAGTITLLG